MSLSLQEALELQRTATSLLTEGWGLLKLGAMQVQVTVQQSEGGATADLSGEDWQRVVLKYQTEKQVLKETIESLLTDSEAGTQPTICIDASEEVELSRLRQEAMQLRQQGLRLPAVQHELDYAEDLLVRVAQGEDIKRLRSQLKVLASALVQAKAQQMAASTAKLATSLSAKLQALEQVNSPSKLRLRLSTCPSTARPTRDRGVLTSPRPSPLVTSRRKEEEEQRIIADLRIRLDRYRSLDDSLALERGRLRAIAQELQVRKSGLDRREQSLFQQEVSVALREDQLRATICRTLLKSEAHEYMRVRANELQQEQFLLDKDRQHLDAQSAQLQRRENEVAELRKVLERRLRKTTRDQTRAEATGKKLQSAREQLRSFLLNMP